MRILEGVGTCQLWLEHLGFNQGLLGMFDSMLWIVRQVGTLPFMVQRESRSKSEEDLIV